MKSVIFTQDQIKALPNMSAWREVIDIPLFIDKSTMEPIDIDGTDFWISDDTCGCASLLPYQIGDEVAVLEEYCRYHEVNYIKKQSGASFSEVSDGYVCYKADGFDSVDEAIRHIKCMATLSLEDVIFEYDEFQPAKKMLLKSSRFKLKVTGVCVVQEDGKWFFEYQFNKG